jgi:thioesterase domain-containing protein
MSPSDLTALLHREIPLTKAMQLRVDSWDGCTITVSAPLAPNLNHIETAFGGSISTLGIVAGYCLVHLLCNSPDDKTLAHILIQHSATNFLRPIDTDMTAKAVCSAEAIAEFQSTLKRKRKARLELPAEVFSGKTLAATHTGHYIAVMT